MIDKFNTGGPFIVESVDEGREVSCNSLEEAEALAREWRREIRRHEPDGGYLIRVLELKNAYYR